MVEAKGRQLGIGDNDSSDSSSVKTDELFRGKDESKCFRGREDGREAGERFLVREEKLGRIG